MHSRAEQQPKGLGWSLAINEKCQLLPYKGELEVALGLHGSVQPDSGMMLLMSGSTLEPGNGQDVGEWELGNK